MSKPQIDEISAELVEQVVTAAVKTYKQGKACVKYDSDGDTACVYASPDEPGVHCAVGHLMTEDELKKYGNVESSAHGLYENWGFRPELESYEARFLNCLQMAHDTCEGSEGDKFKSKFQESLNRFMEPFPIALKMIQNAIEKEAESE